MRTGASLLVRLLLQKGIPRRTLPPTLAQVLDISLKVSTYGAVTVFSLLFSHAIFQANRTLSHPHCTFCCFVVALLLLFFHAACFVFSCLCFTASSTASSDSSEDLIREFCRSPSFLARDCSAIFDSPYGGLRTNEVCLVGSLFSLALLCVLFVCLFARPHTSKEAADLSKAPADRVLAPTQAVVSGTGKSISSGRHSHLPPPSLSASH